MYITDCCFGLKPNYSLITSAIFMLQSTCVSTFGICWGEITLTALVIIASSELHDSSVVEPIASVVLAELFDWVSAESSLAMELID